MAVVTIAGNCTPDARSPDTFGEEKFQAVEMDGSDGIVTLRTTLDECGAAAQPTSDESGGVGLVSE